MSPTLIEIGDIAELKREVFGPVLHVIRYRRDGLDGLIDAINETGYGLTFGLHSRLDSMIAHVASRVEAGNIYVNRNIIGATVGVQPFGGRGLSGTGPKAGGPLYLARLVSNPPISATVGQRKPPAALIAFADWLDQRGESKAAAVARRYGAISGLGTEVELPGPLGERNLYRLKPRGSILLIPATIAGLYDQMAAVLATGNSAIVESMPLPDGLPAWIAGRFSPGLDLILAAVLVQGDAEAINAVTGRVAKRPGAILSVHAVGLDEQGAYPLDFLLEEIVICTNTAAAGGNASLMAVS